MNNENITIRKTNTDDSNNIMQVVKSAFGYDKEAKLTAELLNDKTSEPMLSHLAFDNGEAVGHILFTRAYFDDQQEQHGGYSTAMLLFKTKKNEIHKSRNRK